MTHLFMFSFLENGERERKVDYFYTSRQDVCANIDCSLEARRSVMLSRGQENLQIGVERGRVGKHVTPEQIQVTVSAGVVQVHIEQQALLVFLDVSPLIKEASPFLSQLLPTPKTPTPQHAVTSYSEAAVMFILESYKELFCCLNLGFFNDISRLVCRDIAF